ncbi:hypothetical protein D6T51_26390, partial [Salmonella enterica subsp. enterica serovar Muenchen]|nr:hypothetical protein [Salmonella enterica subsp. enterica serovar Muenchen]
INGNHTGGGVTGGVILTNTGLNTPQGDISITGHSGSTGQAALAGIMMNGGNSLTANSSYGLINMYGHRVATTGSINGDLARYAGMTWKNQNTLSAVNMDIQGVGVNGESIGMQFGDYGGLDGTIGSLYAANVTFNGNVSLVARGGRYGFYWAHSIFDNSINRLNFNGGKVNVNASGPIPFSAPFITSGGIPIGFRIQFNLSNSAVLNITVNASGSNLAALGNNLGSVTIRGNGDVNLRASAANWSVGIDMNNINVNGLNGTLNLTGTSAQGNGVNLGNNADYSDLNITVTGSSNSGNGVVIGNNTTVSGGNVSGTSNSGVGVVTNANSMVSGSNVSGSSNTANGVGINGNISGSNITGTSNSGNGVVANANITISNSNVTGTSNTGNGNGVTVQNNVTISGSDINGTSNAGTGSGVIVNGNTHNFTDTDITGQASGSGNGVTAGGVSGSNVTLNGTATGSGNG